MTKKGAITVFEHELLRVDDVINGIVFNQRRLKALQVFYGKNGVPYFSLIHNGVKFNQYVGVLQVGDTVYEILPKVDKVNAAKNEKDTWRSILVDMLFAVGAFDITAPTSSALNLKCSSLLELYFELFVYQVEYLLRRGLIKKYRSRQGNQFALKGRMVINKHIEKNLTHQERFYVEHSIYDVEHNIHSIIYETILTLRKFNIAGNLHNRLGSLVLEFPEMPPIKVSEKTFQCIVFNRKTESYRKVIQISKLLLLKFHPDIHAGRSDVLAIMFDMNLLWEKFVYACIKKHIGTNASIGEQRPIDFWKPEIGSKSSLRPDIVINRGTDNCILLDTKWKDLKGRNPTPDDLRQMFAYHEYFRARRVALVYPGIHSFKSGGTFLSPTSGELTDKECHVVTLAVKPGVRQLQKEIFETINRWMKIRDCI